jgi:hypothetical protein
MIYLFSKFSFEFNSYRYTKVRDESLAHIKEVTEMFVTSLSRTPTHVHNAEVGLYTLNSVYL